MLQFWRRSGQNDNKSLETSPKQVNILESNKLQSVLLASFVDEGLFDVDDFELNKGRSKLAKSLPEVLNDKGALHYFLQYMETRNASHFVFCWLDIDIFKHDILQFKDQMKGSFYSVPNFKVDHDSLSVSTDCDSYTADTNSLCDYSTATISDKVTQSSSLDVNGFCDRVLSDTSPKLDSLSDENIDKKQLIENALLIFKKYIAQEAGTNIKCSEQIRNEIIENVCDTDNVLTGHSFDKVQNYIYEQMEKEYFEAFLGSDYFCKYQIDILTSGNIVLDDVLHNETALFYFMEFLEQENCRSFLEFWIAATNLQQQLQAQKEFFDPIEAQNDAVVLYDKYFSLQAHCPLGFGDKVRFAVEQNICGENGLVLNCFHLPIKIVEQVLDKNFLKPFLASQLFYKYLSELINTVQSNGYAMNIENNKPSPSDCSSERSFSTNSTFLALEINQNIQKKKERRSDMSIDTRLLCDPDSLWKRRRNSVLSCGRVTALGKFVTDLEPEPDRSGFKFKNVVRKIVSLEEDTKKEEMAWQVAEMIVKDITNITLHQENNLNL